MAGRDRKQGARKAAKDRPASVWHPELGLDYTPRFSAEQHVGTGLRETFRLFAQSVAANLSGLGLSLNMWFVLRSLWEEDGRSQVDLAHKLDVTPAAMVGIVNSLEDLGLVTRERSQTDGRAYRIFLTAAGRSVRTKATRQALQVDAKALRGFEMEEVEALLLYLKRLRQNLSE